MFMSGADLPELYKNLRKDPSEDDGDYHINSSIKFLVAKKERSGLLIVGGSWSQKVDGGDDPVTEEQLLLRTATRCAKDFVSIDLSKGDTTKWIKFIEINYHRPAEVYNGRNYPEMDERTFIYIPDTWNCLTALNDLVPSWEAHQDKLQKLPNPQARDPTPTKPGLLAVTQKEKLKQGNKGLIISLDGLLDYNLDDRLEKTFEVSLFAEAFSEYLQHLYGTKILSILEQYARVNDSQEDDEREAKRVKLEENQTKEPTVDFTLSSDEMLLAFRYFDRNNCGYLRAEDLEIILHNLGAGYSRGFVQDIVSRSTDPHDSSRILYPTIIKSLSPPVTLTTPLTNTNQSAQAPITFSQVNNTTSPADVESTTSAPITDIKNETSAKSETAAPQEQTSSTPAAAQEEESTTTNASSSSISHSTETTSSSTNVSTQPPELEHDEVDYEDDGNQVYDDDDDAPDNKNELTMDE
ncbi:hypothetical protein AKO1_006043 [Acrasis kona]|uniref:EF-hand domain-containing protein n=1 Tax=Acrasis kona TaxID=1008807 RepID=A0AAW2YHY1_9EUKA